MLNLGFFFQNVYMLSFFLMDRWILKKIMQVIYDKPQLKPKEMALT